jgi:hypothetical protein
MWRFVCLVIAAICMVFAACSGVVWHLGDSDVNLYYLSLFFVILAFIPPWPFPKIAQRNSR